jgi:hypothetical protein
MSTPIDSLRNVAAFIDLYLSSKPACESKVLGAFLGQEFRTIEAALQAAQPTQPDLPQDLSQAL